MSPLADFVLNLSWDNYRSSCILASAAGITTHLSFFIYGEHHRYGTAIIKTYLFLFFLLGAAILYLTQYAVAKTIANTFLISSAYFAGLYGSILAYRVLFHPLREFPGPFLFRISSIYHSFLLKNSDNYLLMYKLHEKYGPICRTGPANLSVNVPEAVQAVLGSDSKCSKTPWYEQSLPLVNLHTMRDKKMHDKRRKVFSKAFSPASLRLYEPRVVQHSELFVQQLAKMGGKPFDATRWCKYWAFDIMGELAFGESFRMITEETNRWVPDLLEAGMANVGKFTPIPWATPIIHRIPFLAKGPKRFLEFVGSKVADRSKKPSEKADVLQYLLEDYEKTEKKDKDYQLLRGDTRLTIVGGSDTTAATLTYILYHLAKDPRQITKLRAELKPLLAGGKKCLDPKDVSSAKHLEGIIYEAMRLHPAIPSGYPRLTPPEGISINGTYIPGGTTIMIPLWALGRSEDAYVRANEFIPERWYSQAELIKNKHCFATFSLGPYSCIGRPLALMELRAVVCQILMAFNTIKFAPGEDGTRLMTETKDHFTVGLAPLDIVLDNFDKE
ncbi:hypothetical protein AJ79_02097 [Helicocarpus griseus UAMH5409]|uniref:Cytochrome P450 oxidoreductase n=1 Tax=Helicocarpus griseus UAMH5409 TaxID=1447875 RepID=A0A2B7Y3W2_9EURO|nr:hypothetical protein AJ79_02097 [Helicocarpus griseus UAMH5409]